jgi:hypothetical protein
MKAYFGKHWGTAIALSALGCFFLSCLITSCCCVCISNHRKCCKPNAANVEEAIGMDEVQHQEQQQQEQQEQVQQQQEQVLEEGRSQQQLRVVLERVMKEMLEENQQRQQQEQVLEEGGVRQRSHAIAQCDASDFIARRNKLGLKLQIPQRGDLPVSVQRQIEAKKRLREVNERWGYPLIQEEANKEEEGAQGSKK